jgi:hypothetical protein
MKKLDNWIFGLLDYWTVRARGNLFQQSIHPSNQQSFRFAIRHSSFVIFPAEAWP